MAWFVHYWDEINNRNIRSSEISARYRARFVLWKLIANCGADIVIALAIKTICRSKSAKIGNRFNIPYEDVGHVIRLACIA